MATIRTKRAIKTPTYFGRVHETRAGLLGATLTNHRVVNLNWHGIGPPPRPLAPGEDRIWVSLDHFEQILDSVAGRPELRITFDDGNASDVDLALPRLVERNLTAQFFVLAGELDQPGRLASSAVRELVAAGMSIGSHGWRHRDWRRIRPSEVPDEMDRAPKVLADITGRPVDRVAIPFGSYDRRVIARLRRRPVAHAYTSDGGRADHDDWLQARTSIRWDTTPADVEPLFTHRPSLTSRVGRSTIIWLKQNRPGYGSHRNRVTTSPI